MLGEVLLLGDASVCYVDGAHSRWIDAARDCGHRRQRRFVQWCVMQFAILNILERTIEALSEWPNDTSANHHAWQACVSTTSLWSFTTLSMEGTRNRITTACHGERPMQTQRPLHLPGVVGAGIRGAEGLVAQAMGQGQG